MSEDVVACRSMSYHVGACLSLSENVGERLVGGCRRNVVECRRRVGVMSES
jgi:hypothetical protein